MLQAVCAMLVISSVLSLPVADQDLDSQFEEWKKKHEKVYSGVEEEAMRRAIWEETLKRVEAHNKEADQGLHTFWMGMNQFSDQTKEEKQKWCVLPPINLDLEMEQHTKNFTAELENMGTNSSSVVMDGDVGRNSSMVPTGGDEK